MKRPRPKQLHEIFIASLEEHVVYHSVLDNKPLEIDFAPPLPHKVRLYLYTATHPPGGRTMGEHKIQLIAPGQRPGSRSDFDHSGGRMVILAGYEPETEVFVFWDAGLYPQFAYSRNVQVKAETIYSAYAGMIAIQKRRIRSQGIEMVIAAPKRKLADALREREKLTRERLLGDVDL